jgi:hypothetical protein
MRHKIAAPTAVMAFVFGLICLLDIAAHATSHDLQMPTSGTISGLQFSNDVTDALHSLDTCNSGSTAPSNSVGGVPELGKCWIDTTSATMPVLKQYTGSAWVITGYFDVSNGIWVDVVGGGTATVASATTTDLCTSPQAAQTISGTTTIISFGSSCAPGQIKFVTFLGVLTLTYDGTALIIPGGANVVTAAGDQAIVKALGGGNWQVVSYIPASGQALVNPAVPVGTVLPFSGYAIPANYVEGFGQTVSRASVPNFLAATTSAQSVTRTSGNPTLTGFSDTTRFGYGQCVEGTGIPNSGSCTTFILSCTSTTCTLNNNASSSGTANVTVFFYGNGNGSSTVGVPDCAGRSIAFRDNIGGTAANVAQASTTITTTNGSASASVASASGIARGMTIVSAKVPPGTIVNSVNPGANTLVMSANATGSASGTAARFSGDADAQMMGSTGGAPTLAQNQNELPNTTFQNSGISVANGSFSFQYCFSGCGTAGIGVDLNPNFFQGTEPSTGVGMTTNVTVNNQGSAASGGASAPMLLQNPILRLTCIVRVSTLHLDRILPTRDQPWRRFAANDNAIALLDRRRAA